MYFACVLGLLSMSPASVSSVRRAHRASKPPGVVAAACGRLVKKTTGVRSPLGGRAEDAGGKVSPFPQLSLSGSNSL